MSAYSSHDLKQHRCGLRVLLVEDNRDDAELVLRELKRDGFDVCGEVVQTAEEFTQQVKNDFDVILADYNLPQWRGIEALDVLRKEDLDIPLILVTGSLGDVTAVECIKQGATDYVLKDRLARLPSSVHRALQEKRLREERRQAQEELARKVEELARSNRDLEQFAYVASHDLQEPLRMVASYTQLLAERYRGKLDETADKYIRYAVEGAERMQTLIQDLLSFSRVGRNGQGLVKVDCNLVVEEVKQNLRESIGRNNAVLVHSQLPLVLGERSQWLQVFQNLIGNAIKFRGKDPPQIRVSAERRGDEWQFAVADNGIGIAPEHAELVFVIFKRLHTRAEYAGNGIGLAICKKIVEQNGGRIWVESEPGKGSTFRFTVPMKKVDGFEKP